MSNVAVSLGAPLQLRRSRDAPWERENSRSSIQFSGPTDRRCTSARRKAYWIVVGADRRSEARRNLFAREPVPSRTQAKLFRRVADLRYAGRVLTPYWRPATSDVRLRGNPYDEVLFRDSDQSDGRVALMAKAYDTIGCRE